MKMLTKLLVLLLSALLVASSSSLEDFQDWPTDGTTAPPDVTTAPSVSKMECTQAGLLCTDCTQLSLCVATSTGFNVIPVETCSVDTYCSLSWNNCTTKLNPCQNKDVFKCHSQGRFPDPYDCNVYYECGPSTTAEYAFTKQLICPPNTAYNAATGECSLSIDSDICVSSPVPPCGSSFSSGPLPANANLYYICYQKKPKIYKCNAGEAYNGQTMACEKAEFICPGKGDFADVKDCHRYYTCTDVQHYTHHSCFIGFYFDAKKKRCILGSC